MTPKDIEDLYAKAKRENMVQEDFWHGQCLANIWIILAEIKGILIKERGE